MGVATRKIKKITEELLGDQIPKSTISAWCTKLDEELKELGNALWRESIPTWS